jgi:hypothetical protein
MGALTRKFAKCAAVLLLVATTGCIQWKDHLKVEADGSGRYKYQITVTAQLAAMMQQGAQGGQNQFPMTKEDMEKLVADIEGAKVLSFSSKTVNQSTVITGDVEFTSIENCLKSDLGQMLGWKFEKDGDDLVATIANNDFANGLGGEGEATPEQKQQFGMMKAMMAGLKIEKTLTLPSTVTETNAAKKKASSAKWTLIEIKADTTFEQAQEFGKNIPSASCSAKGVTFTLPLEPKQPARGGRGRGAGGGIPGGGVPGGLPGGAVF